MGIEARGGWRGVSQILLNEPKIDSSLKQMGSPAVAKRMNRRLFVDGALFEGFPESALKTALGHGGCGGRYADTPTTGRREDQDWIAMSDPILAKQLQSTMWQGNITIFTSLTTTDVDKHARTIDMWDLKMGSLLQAQTTGIDR
jgi:hypothetical protein